VSEPDIRKQFAAVVRERRQRLGLSQERFAELCGLHRTYVGAIERGERNVSILNVAKIAKALGVPLHVLFKGIDRE
jgi:transcriptional regulator with XRE-family HTH domain